MKTIKQQAWQWWLTATLILTVVVAIRADNACTETGPHYGSQSCVQSGSINNSGALNFTNINVCIGQTVVKPVLATNVTFNSGKMARFVTYDCPTSGQNHWETNTVTYAAGALYFQPTIPSSFSSSGTYTYSALVNGNPSFSGCTTLTDTVATVTIIVSSSPPIILSQPANQTVWLGSNATFSVVASGCPALTYQWWFNSTNLITGATSASLVIANVQQTNAGYYSVTVSDPSGTTNSSLALLTVINPGYVTLSGTLTNWTFRRDTTYFINGELSLYGTNTFEGGAVFKYAVDSVIYVTSLCHLVWQASAYVPITFTAKDDDSVGAQINGSTGNPTNYYALCALNCYQNATTISHFRVAYAKEGFVAAYSSSGFANFYHGQFVNCQNGIDSESEATNLRNILFANVQTVFLAINNSSVSAQNVTFGDSACLVGMGGSSSLNLTNCILSNVALLTNSGSYLSFSGNHNGFYNSPVFGTNRIVSGTNQFKSIGAGSYYLKEGSVFRDNGDGGIDATLSADLKQKTTYAPLLLTNSTVYDQVLSRQVQRDSDLPDLGYHYDPIDFILWNFTLTNATVTITNGASIACYNDVGIRLLNGSSIVSIGTPTTPNWFVRYSSVQEKPISLGGNKPGNGIMVKAGPAGGVPITGVFQFSDFACPAGGGSHLYNSNAWSYGTLSVQNSEFWSGQNYLGGNSNSTVQLRNNLFNRSTIVATNAASQSVLSLSNNLVWGSLFVGFSQPSNSMWLAFDNDFDSSSFSSTPLTNGYNAYLNCSGRFSPANANDILQAGSLAYQSGPLGDYYQPTNSALLNKGSLTNAGLAGLYHFTTTTNEIKEANSQLDIGYHYVAMSYSGDPFDSNTNGVPDYLEDANGNGVDDSGEAPWSMAFIAQPQSQQIALGSNVTFAVVVVGAAPLTYQWQLNGTNIAGATSSSYSIASVQLTNAGSYRVVAGNVGGSVNSSTAVLTVVTVPVITVQPVSLAVIQGSNVTFSVTATGVSLHYQWRLSGTSIPGATGSSYTRSNVQTADAAAYSVVVTNIAGRVTSANAVLTVYTPPVVLQQPSNQAVLQGTNVTFGVTAFGTTPLFYQWLFNGTNSIVGATNSSLTISNVQAVNAGSYSVRVTNLYGAQLSSNAILTVYVPPTISVQPASQIVVQGNNAVFTVQAGGNPALSYQWRFNGVNITGATSASYTKFNAQPPDVGNYSVVVTNLVGSVTSVNASLSINVPPTITTQPISQTVPQGSNVTFTGAAAGTATLFYQWRFNGINISGATNTSFTITGAQAANAGSYSFAVTNAVGAILSSNATLTVVGVSNIIVDGSSPLISGASTNLLGMTFTLRAMSTPTGLSFPAGFPVWTIVSQPAGSGLSTNLGSNTPTITITPTNAGQYVIKAVSGSSATFTLTLLDPTADSDYDGVNDWQEILDGTNPNNPDDVPAVQMGVWLFDSTNWTGLQGQSPLTFTNVMSVSGVYQKGLQVNTNVNAQMVYRETEPGSGVANFNCRKGSVTFWFQPDWNSGSANGTAPTNEARLLEFGNKGSANGCWGLYLSPGGTNIYFCSQTNSGNVVTNLKATINWTSNYWHYIALTYSPSNCCLYIDSQVVITNGLGISNWPSYVSRTNGFCIGSARGGTNQARGRFDNLRCHNFPRPALDLLIEYSTACFSGMDVELVIDKSGSMFSPQTKFDSAKTGATNFVNTLNFPQDRAGLIAFSTAPATNMQSLTTDKSLVLPAISRISTSGGSTFMSNAIATAHMQLYSNHLSGNLPVMVLLTDGLPDSGTTPQTDSTNFTAIAATWAKTNNTRIVTIALGSDAATNFLKYVVASSTNLFYYAPDPTNLTQIYNILAQALCRTNQAPVVAITNLSDYQVFTVPATIPIIASASDPQNALANVEFYSGTTDLGGALHNPYGINWGPVTNGGTYALTAIATNGYGLCATSAIVHIVVSNPAPFVQITNPVNKTFFTHRFVPVQAIASTPSGTISNVQFYARTNGGSNFLIGRGDPTNGFYQVSWSLAAGGTYILTANVTDSRGSNGWSAPVTNFVRNIPSVSITNPVNNQIFLRSPTNLTLRAVATADPSTTITNVTFYNGTNYQPSSIIGISTSGVGNVFSIPWNNVTIGTYILSARAFDANGASNLSATVSIIVATNQPPAVYIGPDQTNGLSTNALQLVGLVSDDGLPSGTLSVNWTNISGPAIVGMVITNQQTAYLSFSQTGAYRFVLSAYDGQYITYSTNTITVVPANQGPTVSAGTNQTVTLAARYTVTNNLVGTTTSENSKSSEGKEFWLGFPQGFSTPALTLFISSKTTNSGSISVPGLGFFTNFTALPGVAIAISLPKETQVTTDDQVDSKGIHIRAQDDITVYGLSEEEATSDAYLGLPVKLLGTNYLVLGWPNIGSSSEFLIVGTAKGTHIRIYPTADDIYRNRAPGNIININLDEGQTYQLQSDSGDLSGTVIAADKPVALFAGNRCADVPDCPSCDIVVEQIPPADAWGKEFYTVPLAERNGGDIFQVLASADGTTVWTNGVPLATLTNGQVFMFLLADRSQVKADKSILLAQYARGQECDPGNLGGDWLPDDGFNYYADPFMMLIPPFEQFLTHYTIGTPTIGFPFNYVNIVTANNAVTNINIRLDGSIVDPTNFFSITNGFYGAQIQITNGSHTLESALPFGAYVYGWDLADGYGYPGGMSLGSVADISKVLLIPKFATDEVGTTYCFTANVTGASNQPLSGIRVDFQIKGSNSVAGSAYTDENGQADFCYAGTNSGNDVITASVGANSDVATNIWTYPSFTLHGSVSDDGLPVGKTNILWALLSGPPIVGISAPTNINPLVQITEPGFYSFKLTADDTVLTNSAQVGISVVRNQAPSVNPGTNLTTKSASVTLHGSVTDDGLPAGSLTTTWSKASGPGSVTFGNANQPVTSATFGSPGVYVLRLTGNDSQAAVYADVAATVLINPQPIQCAQVVTGNLASTALHSIELTNSYADYYQFSGQSNHFVVVTLTSTNFDAYLIIRNQQLQIMAEEDDCFDDTIGSTNSLITYCLPVDGNYIIEVASALGQQTGSYTLQFQCGLPVDLEITSPADGTIYPNVPAAVTVNAIAANFDDIQYVELDTNGVRLDNFISLGDNINNTYSWPSVSAGTYSLTAVVYDYSSTAIATSAPVVIHVGMPSMVLSPSTECIKLLPGLETLTASLKDASGNPVVGNNITFTVTGANPTNATIVTSGSGVASFSYTGINSGRDIITATATVGGLAAQAAVERDWAKPISCGQILSAPLTNSSGTSSRMGYADYYSFSSLSNDTVAVTLGSSAFDTYLLLRDANCNLVASNDDFNGTDSQIIYTLPANGTYVIEATSYAPGQTGLYTLQLECNPVTANGAPEIVMLQGSQILSNYATVSFGATTVTNPIPISLTISNSGTTALALGPVQAAGDFVVSNWPAASIPAGGAASFIVRFNASTNEIQVGQLGFANNDADESPFILNLSAVANIPGTPPTATITSPVNNSVFSFGTNVSVAATATASGGYSITNVDFVVLTGAGQMLIGTKTTPPYTINWANANPGYYALYAVAYDSAGRVGYSTPAVNVLIQIQSTNHPPVANSDTVTVSAGSFNNVIYPLKNDFDSDGDHLTIVGVQPSTLTPQHPSHGIPIIMPGGQSIQYTPPPGQGYPIDGFSYQISDSRGGTSWGSVYVNAFAPPEPRVTLTNPPDRYSTNAGAIVPLVAYVDVANQYITNVDFYLGQVVIGRMTNGVNGFYTNYWTASYDNCGCGFTAQAEDSFGQIGTSQEIHIDVTQPTNGTLVVGLDNLVGSSGSIPLTNGVIIRDGLLSIYGQAYHTATNIVAWRLDLFAGDGTNFIRNLTPSPDTNGYHWGPIGSSDTTNVLTTNCDLTTIQNGSYDLKLTAVGGYTMQSVDARIILDSTLKIGQFSFSQQDLAIPVDGIPLTITRTYNSLNPVRGDFGYSWTFSINSMDVSIDETRGDVEDFDNYVFNRRSGGGYDVSLTMPDGHRTTFYCNLRNGGSTTYYAEWEIPPDAPDVQSFVCMGDNRLQTFLALGDPSAQPYWQATGAGVPMEAYDFPGFVLTMKDGTTYIISREDLGDHDMSGDTWLSAEDQEQAWGRPYLSQILERNGDTINISSTSVTFTATNGATRQIEFNRNADGLITSVSDPSDLNSDGTTNGSPPAVKYEYDAYDNLMYVERLVDRNLGTYATNSFAYEYPTFPHYITGIFNADGTQVAKNFYDDSGRLIALQDADGKITRFIHNSTYDMEVVIDRLGRTNTYVYDSRGNVILETNALNQATFNSYDNNNNLLSTTDALNNTTRYAYDSNNRRIQVVDALNHTNFFSYSPGGDFTGLTDPLGNVATNLYDGSGNLTNTTQLDPQNHVIAQSSSVYQGGRLFQTLNGNGQATATFGYDPATGYLTASTDANGFAHTFAYDANGSQTNSSYNWVDSGGTTHIVTAATIHDAQGRVAMTIDADGNTNQTFYTVNGKVSYTIDTFGNTNSFTYDARGNVIQIVYPNGTFARTVYDDDAKPILMTDPNQITGTFNQYDALGRMTNVVRLANVSINLISDPTNTSLSTSVIGSLGIGLATNATVYMANGWVQSRTGADGKITSYDYWPDGQIKTVTDPLNHTTFYQYDAAGHQQFITDALNHTNRFTYDPVGRLIKTLYANNTFTTNVFDNLGQRIGIKDQASLLTQFGYDVSGRLTNVIKPSVIDTNGHPVNPTWSYRYDQYERLTATIDPNSRATTNLYDALGRQISQRLPMGQTNYAVYNSKGQLWKQYDFKNQRSEFVYDRFGRVKARFLFQAGATNPDEAVCYLYNQLNQLTNVVERYGADASTNACDGYAALVGFPKDNHGLEAELLASFNQKPSLAGALAVALLALTFACVPREKRRRFVLRLVDAWRIQLLVLAPVGVESTRLRKRWMPSLFWRAVSMLIMLVFIADDPAFERFYTARADCSVPFNGSTPTTRYTYFSYDLEGNLTQVNSPEGVINCDYDLTTGRLMGICTGNSEVDYRYDELGRLQYVTVIRRNGQVLSTLETTMYHYDAAGNRSEVDLPNGVKTFYAYDSLNRLTNLVHQLGAVTNASYSYKLDGTERRTNAVEVLRQEDNSYLTNVLSWQFDGMYRLTNEVSLSTTSSGAYAYTNAYQYDNAGNRVKKTRTGGGAEAIAYQYDNNDQLTNEVSSVNGTTTYRYDQNGSLTNRTQGSTVNSYVYDAANKLRSVTVNGTLAASYLYDEQGIRVSSTSGGTTTHYLIDANNCTGYAQVVEERIGSSSVPSMSYVIGDEVLAQCGATSTAPNYFLVDGHGSNRQLTRADGTVSSHYGYDAYGMVQTGNAQAVTSSSTAEVAAADGASRITSKLYCGEQYDSNLHMYNLRARYYDPADGRFNQRDTMEGSNFDPENLHKYLYCTSDPIDKIDPSGNQGEIEELVVTAIEGILFAINAVSVVNGVLGAIVFGFSAINAWMDGLFWDGCGYAIMAALNGLSAALSYMGMKASLKPPSGLSGGLALAMNGGATAVWEVAVAHPEALAWGIKVVAPAAFGVYMMMKNGKVPIQEHHKVPWSNSKYDFKNHPLIKRAGVNLEKDPRNLMDLANHAGRHSKIYLEAVLKRLDDAWASLGGNPSQAAADAKFKEVVDQIEKDISNGSLRPYNPPHDVWIP